MAKIQINKKEYETDTLSEQAKQNVNMLAMTEQKIRELQRDLAIAQTAHAAYGKALQEQLPKDEN